MSAQQSPFNRLMGELDYSMLVVTTAAGGERAGCLVGFASQVSIRPPRFLVCLSVKNRTFRVARQAQILIVHFVALEQAELAGLFGGQTGDDMDKFSRCRWRPGPDGAPVLCDLENWFAGRVLSQLAFGDHCGFLLEPVQAHTGRGTGSLNFHRARAIEPGHPA